MAKLSVRWRLHLDSVVNSNGSKCWQRDTDDIVERVLGPRYIRPKQPRAEVFGQCMYYLELAEVALRGKDRRWRQVSSKRRRVEPTSNILDANL